MTLIILIIIVILLLSVACNKMITQKMIIIHFLGYFLARICDECGSKNLSLRSFRAHNEMKCRTSVYLSKMTHAQHSTDARVGQKTKKNTSWFSHSGKCNTALSLALAL